ncbi:MAG: DUF6883 domain-containing protein [Methylococcales bacterium]
MLFCPGPWLPGRQGTASGTTGRSRRESEAIATDLDAYGQRYVVDFEMLRGGRKATVRSSWIIRTQENFPRLTSCFVL